MKSAHKMAIAAVLTTAAIAAIFFRRSTAFRGVLAGERRNSLQTVEAQDQRNDQSKFPHDSAISSSKIVGTDSAPLTRAALSEKAARKAEAEFNEIVTRNVALDYAPFLASLHIGEETRDLVLKAIGDRFVAATNSEKLEYDNMVRKLLGSNAFDDFEKYRDRLPIEKQVNAGLLALTIANPRVSNLEQIAVRSALEAIPFPNPVAIAAVEQPVITDQDIARVRDSYESLFNKAVASANISTANLAILKQWYLEVQIMNQMQVIRIQQQILQLPKPKTPGPS